MKSPIFVCPHTDDERARLEVEIRPFDRDGIDACLTRRFHRPQRPATTLDSVAAERLRALWHQGRRPCGQPTSLWPLE